MATQSIPTLPRTNNAATVPALVRPGIMQRRLRPTAVRMAPRRDAKQEQEKQQMLVDMLPLVKRVAFQIREHLPAHVEVNELIANGVLGLVDAVSKYDSTKRVKLESYARHRVRGGILDGLRGADPASRDLRRKNKQIQKLYRQLENKLGRAVRDEEIAEALGMSMAQWHGTLNEIQCVGFDFGARPISAGPTTKSTGRRVEAGLLADDGAAGPFERCYRREQREILARALSHLRPRDRQIITYYYEDELTMKQIADRLAVDESRVSQLHSAALVRLRATVSALLRARPNGKPANLPSLPMEASAAA